MAETTPEREAAIRQIALDTVGIMYKGRAKVEPSGLVMPEEIIGMLDEIAAFRARVAADEQHPGRPSERQARGFQPGTDRCRESAAPEPHADDVAAARERRLPLIHEGVSTFCRHTGPPNLDGSCEECREIAKSVHGFISPEFATARRDGFAAGVEASARAMCHFCFRDGWAFDPKRASFPHTKPVDDGRTKLESCSALPIRALTPEAEAPPEGARRAHLGPPRVRQGLDPLTPAEPRA